MLYFVGVVKTGRWIFCTLCSSCTSPFMVDTVNDTMTELWQWCYITLHTQVRLMETCLHSNKDGRGIDSEEDIHMSILLHSQYQCSMAVKREAMMKGGWLRCWWRAWGGLEMRKKSGQLVRNWTFLQALTQRDVRRRLGARIGGKYDDTLPQGK